ncbi:unnamed protein product, partial [Timema podura]|nr:unnamed protein product [Timema podura]
HVFILNYSQASWGLKRQLYDTESHGAVVVTLESTSISACSSGSLVSKGRFVGLCLRSLRLVTSRHPGSAQWLQPSITLVSKLARLFENNWNALLIVSLSSQSACHSPRKVYLMTFMLLTPLAVNFATLSSSPFLSQYPAALFCTSKSRFQTPRMTHNVFVGTKLHAP